MPNKRLKRARQQIQSLTFQLQKQKLKHIQLETILENIKNTSITLQCKLNQSNQLLKKVQKQVGKVQNSCQTEQTTILVNQQLKKTKDGLQQKLQKLFEVQKLVQINKVGLISTIQKYNTLNQFHADSKLHMLNFCSKIISIFQNAISNVKIEKSKTLQDDSTIKFYIKQPSNPEQSIKNSTQIKSLFNHTKNSVVQDKLQTKQNKNKLTPQIKIALNKLNSLKNQVLINKSQLRSTINSYSSSNYFHVGPRYHMLGFCRKVIKIAQQNYEPSERSLKKDQQILLDDNMIYSKYTHQQCLQMVQTWREIQNLILDNKSSLQSTIKGYNSSNYFHVGPRYQMLDFCSDLINCFQGKK